LAPAFAEQPTILLPDTGTGPADVTMTSQEFLGFLGVEIAAAFLIGTLCIIAGAVFVVNFRSK
jgi:hypothetical protein